jgi:hypothetical protein
LGSKDLDRMIEERPKTREKEEIGSRSAGFGSERFFIVGGRLDFG